jgi:beta-galactosidase
LRAPIAACPLLLACADAPAEGPAGFPDDFLWGAAMAGFQVDPGCPTLPAEDCEDRGSDWYQWVTDPELVADASTHVSGQPLSDGPGHWELYAEDYDRAADALGLDSLRISLEWSRLFPDAPPPDADTPEELALYADADAVAAYHDQLDALAARGLRPMVTLNHYTLPLWIHDGKGCHADLESCSPRGWMDGEETVRRIGEYAAFCAWEYGAQVDLWATLNEPLAVVLAGYMLPTAERTNPPGTGGADAGVAVLYAMAEGHAAMYDAVHAHDPVASVGAVPNLAAVQPDDPEDPEDLEAVEHFDHVYNRAFLDATVYGELDLDLDGAADASRPDLAGRMDFIGVNYYTRIVVAGIAVPLFGDYAWTDFVPLTTWDEYPEGLGEVATLAGEYGTPVYITENGTPDLEGAEERFLGPHLDSLRAAVDAGVDVRGYYFWSLIDNYEWNHGMDMRFGLYEVDPQTKARSLRPIGEAYAAAVARGGN